jgi:hypothetical protein
MRAAIDTEPAPSVAPGLGAGNNPRAGAACPKFISLPIGAAPCGGRQIDCEKSVGKRGCRKSSGEDQHAIGGKGRARRRFKEAHHVH